jgi:hypothetical protein
LPELKLNKPPNLPISENRLSLLPPIPNLPQHLL